MSKQQDLLKVFLEEEYTFTTEEHGRLGLGEHTVTLTKAEEETKDDKSSLKLTFENKEGSKHTALFFPKSEWLEKSKEYKNITAENAEAIQFEEKYCYIKAGIALQLFSDLEGVYNLPDTKSFINVLIKKKIKIKIKISKTEPKKDSKTGEMKSYDKVWFPKESK